MARLRSAGLLSCFYCGRRSTVRFQPGLDSFDCRHCEATNYLDEQGDITDPPVATEAVAPRNAPRGANTVRGGGGGGGRLPATATAAMITSTTTVPSILANGPSLPNGPSDTIFCDKCLKNQRLFTASLAQYYSEEDPDASESEAPDRDYYKFRKGLEERYPQVCDDCSGRVSKAIEKAGYTAKTDHLRKMMDRSRQERTVRRKSATTFDWFAAAGRLFWWGGLVLQMLWHLASVMEVLSREARPEEASGMSDPDDEGRDETAAAAASIFQLQRAASLLPSEKWFVQSIFVATVLSAPWNPHFVQVVRGFSRHLVGVRQWYIFQAIIFVVRFSLVYWNKYSPEGLGAQAVISAHVGLGAMTALLYFRALTAIRVDTTPLFATHESTVTAKSGHAAAPKPGRGDEMASPGPKSMSELLYEALDAPGANPLIEESGSMYQDMDFARRRPSARLVREMTESSSTNGDTTVESTGYEEMDWTPTPVAEARPLPRALAGSTLGPGRAFGQAPTQAEPGPFWYKVPEAPLGPAHRARNPPRQTSLRSNPNSAERGSNMFFRGRNDDKKDGQNEGARGNGNVAFRQPHFFAGDRNNEEDSALANMLGRTFTLGQDGEEQDDEGGMGDKSPQRRRRDGPGRPAPQTASERQQLPVLQAGAIAGSMLIWLLSLSSPIARTADLQLGILIVAGVASLSLVLTRTKVGAAATVGQMAALGWVAQETQRADADAGMKGLALLGCMLGHLVWDLVSGGK